VLLILVFDLVNLKSIVVEKNSVLRVQAILKVLPLKDSLELSQQFKGVLNAGNNFEVLINVMLELSLN